MLRRLLELILFLMVGGSFIWIPEAGSWTPSIKNILSWVLFGGISGFVATLFLKSTSEKVSLSPLYTVVGSVVAGSIMVHYFPKKDSSGWEIYGLLPTVAMLIGYLVYVAIWRRTGAR